MYTRQQASQLRQSFWTTFGQYMSPILSAEGLRTNWINYKTGEPHLTFKMDATDKCATIAIVLAHPDLDIQQLYLLKEDWPQLIAFFKQRIIALDSFWDIAKLAFESLR